MSLLVVFVKATISRLFKVSSPLLLETPAIVTCFVADHGNTAWRAGLPSIAASKQD
jgi:hypothetical protein